QIAVRVTGGASGPSSYGVFDGANKRKWYEKLFAANASGGTPLRRALQRTGEYYKNFGSSGPWGPETGANQYSCRQSFAILTTDGYWNSDSVNVGNQDGSAGSEIKAADGIRSFKYEAKPPFKDTRSN